MAAGRLLLLPSSVVLLFYAHLLSMLLGQQSAVSEGELKRTTVPEANDYLQGDGFAAPVETDNRIEGRISSPVLSAYPLAFEPPSLDFQTQNVGMPRLQRVRITNPSKTQTLQLTSISGDSPDFHPSFFKSKVVKAGDSTTFDVVFLARVIGAVQNTLYIHTSLGTFDYKVQGIGTPNPFRLRSLLGARIPLNATYSPLITMYNPFSTSLQVTEMYSSGGELHLELLNGQPQGSKTLWEIRPYETKPIARANFFGRTAINHTSFIRVKTSHTASPSLVLPVEVEVSESPGLYLSRELLDFGMLKTGESKLLPLYVLNSGGHQVHIKSISIEPENPAVEIEYTTTLLRPGSKYTKIAMVTFYSDRVTSHKQQSGRLIIRAEGRQSHHLEVPYDSHVLHGSLSYEKSQTLFRVGRPPFNPIVRNISLSNQFNVPVVIYDLRLPSRAQEYFSVVAFRGPYIIPALSEWHQPFSITFLATSSDCLFNTTLRLSTNASLFNIPLHCYDGRVKFHLESLDDDVLDYGILSDSDVVNKTFILYNPNPIRVSVLSYFVSDNLPHTTVELLAIQPDSVVRDKGQPKKMPLRPPFTVDPDYVAIFRVNITHPKKLGTFNGEITITTSFEKVWHIPVYYKTAVGSLKTIPEKIVFLPTFPFGTSRLPLMVKSLYPQPIMITTVDPVPADSRFYAVNERIHRFPILKPNALTELATLVFDPLLGNRDNVYLGVGRGSSWNPFSTGEKQRDPGVDMREFAALWSTWNSILDQQLNILNFSISIRTELGTDFKIPAAATLSWPHLFAKQTLEFLPTTVGNSTIQTLELSNPTSRPLMIQPVFLHHYTRPHTIVNLLADRMDPELRNFDFSRSTAFAFQVDSQTTDSAMNNVVIPAHSESYPITVAFTPKVDLQVASLLLIRNNLTVLDYVLLEGCGHQGMFTIDNVPPESEPLLFEFSTTQLEKCQAGSLFEPLVLSKSFKMHNAGTTPLNILSVEVGGGGCEEHGFAVSNCGNQISIQPNRSKTIEITFVPDFTLSRVSNTLRIKTSEGTEMLFPLLAVLPHYTLAACYAVQPRPEWEKKVAWFSVPFWLVILLAIFITVLVQTNFGMQSKPFHHADSELPAVEATRGQVFDLRDIITKTLSEKISALKTSVHSDILKSSKEYSRDPNEATPIRRVKVYKPLEEMLLESDASFSQEINSREITHHVPQLERQTPSDPRTFSRHPFVVPTSSKAPMTSKATVTNAPTMNSMANLTPVVTDSKTGMREVSTLDCLTLNHGNMHEDSATKSSPRAAVTADSGCSNVLTSPDLIPEDASTPTMATGTLPHPRRIRGTRKTNGKFQRLEHSIPLAQTELVVSEKNDQLERKESESSIKSTDSESTTSSSDKSEDKDDNGTVPETSRAEYEIKLKPPPPLTKEPNTGQTVPMHADTPEDTPAVKNEAFPEPSLAYHKKEKESTTTFKTKGKKRLKHQMKREEKLRRRENKREKEREKEQEKEEQNLLEKDQESFESTDKDSSTSNSTENLNYEGVELVDEVQGSVGVEEMPSPERKLIKDDNKPARNYTDYVPTPVDQPMLEESPEQEVETSTSPEPFEVAYQDVQGPPGRSDGSETSESSPPPPPEPTPNVHPPVGAVPSTAIKARGRNSKPQVVELLSDPFSRNPDRSTYASKKSVTKKYPENTRAGAVEATTSKSRPTLEGPVAKDVQAEAAKQQFHSLQAHEATSPDAVAEDATIAEVDKVETDGVPKLGVQKSSQLVPTSPHEIAASLLSNVQKKLKNEKDRSSGTEEIEEAKEAPKSNSITVPSSRVTGPSKHAKQQSGNRSPQKVGSHSKPPTTLSLDAEPFYPSADFQQKLFRVRPDQHHHKQKYANTLADYIPPSLNAPPGFSPEEAGMAFTSSIPSERKYRKWGMDHPQHHSKGTTPPPFPSALGDNHQYHLMESPGLDPQEPFGYSSDPPFYDAVEDPQALYAAGGVMGVGRMRRSGGGAADPRDNVGIPSRLRALEQADPVLAAALIKRQQQQQQLQQQQLLAAHRRAARERTATTYPAPSQSSLWDHPNSYQLQALQEEEELALQQHQQQQRQLLQRQYYHQQARRSAEALSSLNQPPAYRPRRSAVFSPELNQPSANLWDGLDVDLPSQHNLDDSFLSEAVHAQQLRQQLLQEQVSRTARHATTRRRTYSGESDLGGEIVTNLHSAHGTSTSVNPPGLNRAPGTFSGYDQPRRTRSSQTSALQSGWPADFTESTSSGWSGIWSLDSPFASDDRELGANEPPPPPPSSQPSSSQPFTGGTYDLFENQSIWSLSGGDNSGLLSWAPLKYTQDKSK